MANRFSCGIPSDKILDPPLEVVAKRPHTLLSVCLVGRTDRGWAGWFAFYMCLVIK